MIPYEKLSAALDAHRRRVRGEPEPLPSAEPEILDASDLVAEEDAWIEPAEEQGEQWTAQEARAEAAPPMPLVQDQSWDDAGQEAWPTTDEWQAEAVQESMPVTNPGQTPEPLPVATDPGQSPEPMPVTPDEWTEAPGEQAQDEWVETPGEPQQADWTEQPAAAEQAQAQEGWPEEPPISPEDFAQPERIDGPIPEAERQGDEWAIPTVPPAPDTPPAPQDLPPPPAPDGSAAAQPQGQPARTIFGMPAPPRQPPAAPQDQQAGQQGDDLVIVDEEPDNNQ